MGSMKAIIFASLIAVFFSLFRAVTPNYYTLLIVTAMFGVGMAFYFPNLSKTVNEHFPKNLVGRATGIYIAAIPFGSGLGIALTKHLLLLTGSWRHAVALWSGITIPLIIICLLVIHKSKKRTPNPNIYPYADSQTTSTGDSEQPIGSDSSKKPYFLPILICGLLLLLLNCIFFTTIGWVPTYLIEEGWEPIPAGMAASIISFLEVPAILLVPFLSHRIGKTKSIIMINFLCIAVLLLILSLKPSFCWVLAPLLGMTFGGTFVLLMAFPAQFSLKAKVGRAAGAILSIGYIGALLGPFSAGYLRDVVGNFFPVFLVMVGASVLAFFLSLAFPNLEASSKK